MPPEDTREDIDVPYTTLPENSFSQEQEDRYEAFSQQSSSSETDDLPEVNQAEQWLTRGRRDLLVQWGQRGQQQHQKGKTQPHKKESPKIAVASPGNSPTSSSSAPVSIDASDCYEVDTNVQSSYSSPGKSSLKERLERRLLQRKLSPRNRSPHPETETQQQRAQQRVENLVIRPCKGKDDDEELSPRSPQSDSAASMHRKKLRRQATSAPRRRIQQVEPSVLRLSRTVRFGRRGPVPHSRPAVNSIKLHIYDLLANDTIMQLPWGCEFPIGRCLVAMNNGLNALGTGVYHCGVEINNVEYAYGANEIQGSTGVFTCLPKHSPGYEYRTTIDFGCRPLHKQTWRRREDRYETYRKFVDGREIMREMAAEYKGLDYDLLRKNCCTFAKDACLRLGVKPNEIPSWFMNLADAGAKTQDVANKTMSVFGNKTQPPRLSQQDKMEHPGYEAIHQEEFVTIVEAVENPKRGHYQPQGIIGLRRTLSWTY